MKIGIFDPYLDSFSGGEKYMLTIASCLAKDHIVSLFWDPQQEREVKEKALKIQGIDIANISFTKNIFSSDVSFISRFFSSRKFDCILILSDGSLPFVASKLYVHFQAPMLWIDGSSLKTRLKVARVRKFICNSEFTKAIIDKKLRVNSSILYPPVEIKREPDEKENIILNVGRFGINWAGSSYKKQDVLVSAFKKMVDQGLTKWKLIFVVSFKDQVKKDLDLLKEMAKGYPIEFIENPTNNQLWDLYAKTKIYWHAAGFGEDLEKNPDRAEHFGIVTVEAMGSGAVPVVIRAGGQPEIVKNEENGFLWETLQELEEKTILLINNPKRLEAMAIQAKQRSLTFVGDRFCQQVQEIMT